MHFNSWWSQSGPPWYIVIVIGSLVGVMISSVGPVLSYPIRRFRKDQYIGTWYEYHWTWHDGAKKLWHAQLGVRHGVRSRYVVSFDHLPSSASSGELESPLGATVNPLARILKYSGDLRTEGGHVVLTLQGKTHRESLVYRFRAWIPSSSDRIIGLWMSFDHSGSPAAGGAVLSSRKLQDEEAIHLMEGNLASSRGLLRVTK